MLFAAFVACLLLSATGYAQQSNDMSAQGVYEREWKKIDSLEAEGLPRSALAEVEKLQQQARADDEEAQVIKTIIYQSKYITQLEEDGKVAAIQNLQSQLAGSGPRVAAVLHSVLGQLYATYADNNVFQIRERSELAGEAGDDIRTWSLDQLLTTANQHYRKSVSNPAIREAEIENFAAITTEALGTDALRPTLFDFLAHRAIEHFSNERTYINDPSYKFVIRDPVALGPIGEFIRWEPATRDTQSFHLQAIHLLQELLAFHRDDDDPRALIEAELERFKFAYQHAVLADKRERYLTALRRLETRFRDNPEVARALHARATVHRELGNRFDPFTATEWRGEFQQALDICQQCQEDYPKSYGSQLCAQLAAEIRAQYLSMQMEKVHTPGKPLLASLKYRNVEQAHYRVVRLTEEEWNALDTQRFDARLEQLLGQSALQEGQLDLPNPGDFQPHHSEFKIDPLPLGWYAVLLSRRADFAYDTSALTGYARLQVSNLAYFDRRNARNNNEFLVVHRQTGEPLEGVNAQFFTRKYNRSTQTQELVNVGSARTDRKGLLRPDLPNYTSHSIRFSLGEDVLHYDDYYSNYSYQSDDYSNYSDQLIDNQRRLTTRFFLDRAIYRPGQTIHFKGIALEKQAENDYRVLAEKAVSVRLRDVNGQVVEEKSFTTNEYGTFNGVFTAPEGGLRGRYNLASSLGYDSHGFQIEEYKRPRFEVLLDRLEKAYALEDTVELSGRAKAYAGSNIDGAQVSYRVVRKTVFPWWRARAFRSFPPPFGEKEMEIANGLTTTDINGQFQIQFPAIPDESIPRENRPAFYYTVYADVTDITGETHSAERTIRLGYISLLARIDAPREADRRDSLRLDLQTVNLDGQAQATEARLQIQRLESPDHPYRSRYWQTPDQHLLSEADFAEAFPRLPYRDEDNPRNWGVLETVYDQSLNTGDTSSLQLDAGDWEVGHYRLQLRAISPEGDTVTARSMLLLYDAEAQRIPSDVQLLANLSAASAEPGDTSQLVAASADELQLFLEIERQGEIIDQRWLRELDWQTIDRAIQEADRGNIHFHLTTVKDNRPLTWSQTLSVPWTNKQLTFEYLSFRDKLRPGQEEEWRIKISGPGQEQVAAEMVATLYDASLDEFVVNDWSLPLYSQDNYRRRGWSDNHFQAIRSNARYYRFIESVKIQRRRYREMQWFNFYLLGYGRQIATRAMTYSADPETYSVEVPDSGLNEKAQGKTAGVATDSAEATTPPPPPEPGDQEEAPPLQIRTNLDETVFFRPELRTDADGSVLISFTMNEALTRWKFLGLAHTKDLLQVGATSREIVTQKELMVLPNPPRFVREGDEIEYTAKVSNLSSDTLRGTATLELFDALRETSVDEHLGNTQMEAAFVAPPGQSARLSWDLTIPEGELTALKHRVIARAGQYGDGEEDVLPVLTNRVLVTETLPMTVRAGEKEKFELNNLARNTSETLTHERLTLEFTTNPNWYAVKALPYLMEYPHDCTEQVFNRYYANAVAGLITEKNPAIQRAFDQWKDTDALESNLLQNQELKAVLIEETPWVQEAQSESEQRARLAMLFDLEQMRREQQKTFDKLVEQQNADGSFSWFPGGRPNRYVTQYILAGLGHLKTLGINDWREQPAARQLLESTVAYLDRELLSQYQRLQEMVEEGKADPQKDHLNALTIHYLYARSFFEEIPPSGELKKARDYYLRQAEEYWLNKGVYQEGMIALAAGRHGKEKLVERIVKSLEERAIRNPELGMYWKYDRGYYWHELPIETHALLIELFTTNGQEEAVQEMKLWLLKNKQTNHWSTTKATADAVYALLVQGVSASDAPLAEGEAVDLDFANVKKRAYKEALKAAEREAEAGSGYYKVSWSGNQIDEDWAEIKVRNPNAQISWGAMYWQYFEDLDRVERFEETPLQLKKQLYREKQSPEGPILEPVAPDTELHPGDKLVARMELRVDRPMEFVHLKDLRASGLEPLTVLSRYRYQDGLGYYQSTGDAATHFFFDQLPRGTYVFEYPLRVVHRGDFSNGMATIQCMYAPEFSSHSQGVRLKVSGGHRAGGALESRRN